jgi:hypothetical protein
MDSSRGGLIDGRNSASNMRFSASLVLNMIACNTGNTSDCQESTQLFNYV